MKHATADPMCKVRSGSCRKQRSEGKVVPQCAGKMMEEGRRWSQQETVERRNLLERIYGAFGERSTSTEKMVFMFLNTQHGQFSIII